MIIYDVVATTEEHGPPKFQFVERGQLPFGKARYQTDPKQNPNGHQALDAATNQFYQLLAEKRAGTVNFTESRSFAGIRGPQGGVMRVAQINGQNHVLLPRRSRQVGINPNRMDISAGRLNDGEESDPFYRAFWTQAVQEVEEVAIGTGLAVEGTRLDGLYVPQLVNQPPVSSSLGLTVETINDRIEAKIRREAGKSYLKEKGLKFDQPIVVPMKMMAPKNHARFEVYSRGGEELSHFNAGFAVERYGASVESTFIAHMKLLGPNYIVWDTEGTDLQSFERETFDILPTGTTMRWRNGAVLEVKPIGEFLKEIADENAKDGRSASRGAATEKVVELARGWPIEELGAHEGVQAIVQFHDALAAA